ncbi:hypothetical protein FRC12_020964 [Ceratobasidium sp. 428]|nr:hypothetical protein FRC12_020964 [Ceratobasidium sp. 428]
MEAHDKWIEAQLHLREAATNFLDACLALKKVAAQSLLSHPDRIVLLEAIADDVQSKIDSIGAVESQMYESRVALNALLGHSTSRAPINKLPTDILSRIFIISVGSSPCSLLNHGYDILLDIPRVCSRWYQVATTNRLLWSHIDIGLCPKGINLNLVRLWLERSHGVQIHIHVNKNTFHAPNTAISNLVSILQPYQATTSSLLISGVNSNTARPLLALCFGDSGPGALRALSVSSIWDREVALPWPTYPIPELTSLELSELQNGVCPSLDELVTILSDCPRLHTLRLAQFGIRFGDQQNYRIILLPCLKLLELALHGNDELAAFLTLVHPGGLELHVRLRIQSLGEGLVPRAVQLLLARSNVVSLTLCNLESYNAVHIQSLFSCVPRLRALRVDRFDHFADTLLRALANYDTLQPLPSLQLLCLSLGEVHPQLMTRVKLAVGPRQLRSLLFWSCTFPPFFNDQDSDVEYKAKCITEAGNIDTDARGDEDEIIQTQNDDQHQNQDDSDDDEIRMLGPRSGTPGTCFPFQLMPTSIKRWLSEHVERFVVSDSVPSTCIINGIDVLAQEMLKTESKHYM